MSGDTLEFVDNRASRKVRFVCGWIMLCTIIPVVAIVVGTSVLWDCIDPITMRVASWINKATYTFNQRFVKHEADGFLVNAIVYFGVIIPSVFAWNAWYTVNHGFSLWLAFAYNVFRIGPYFMSFAYVYTLCHKEGHSIVGQYKGIWNSLFRNIFNWWIGLFFGVMPSTFAYGHTRNHHKYNNELEDIISIADAPRDSFHNFVAYVPRFSLYSINVSTVERFAKEGRYNGVAKMCFGTLYYAAFLYACFQVDFWFGVCYGLYPSLENIALLACVNWSWHAFMDPKDFDNEYAASTTILGDMLNVLNEDYHVVHHMFPAAHWTQHPVLYKKHKQDYIDNRATIFQNTHVFELFFLIILKEYRKMAEKFVDLSGKLTVDEKEQIVIERLRAVRHGVMFEHRQKSKKVE